MNDSEFPAVGRSPGVDGATDTNAGPEQVWTECDTNLDCSPEAQEVFRTLDEYRADTGKTVLTWNEVVSVLRTLGFE